MVRGFQTWGASTLRMERAISRPPTAWRCLARALHSAGLSAQAAGPGATADSSRRSLQLSGFPLAASTCSSPCHRTEWQHLPSSLGRCQLLLPGEQFQLAPLLRSASFSSSCSYHALGLLVFRSYLLHLSRSHHRSASTVLFPGFSQPDAFPPEEE